MKVQHAIPKWLRVVNNLLFGCLAFWLTALVVGVIVALVAKVLKIEIEGAVPVMSTIVVCLLVGIAGSILATRWWDGMMHRRSIKANYIALAILVLIAVVLSPGPMVFVE